MLADWLAACWLAGSLLSVSSPPERRSSGRRRLSCSSPRRTRTDACRPRCWPFGPPYRKTRAAGSPTCSSGLRHGRRSQTGAGSWKRGAETSQALQLVWWISWRDCSRIHSSLLFNHTDTFTRSTVTSYTCCTVLCQSLVLCNPTNTWWNLLCVQSELGQNSVRTSP